MHYNIISLIFTEQVRCFGVSYKKQYNTFIIITLHQERSDAILLRFDRQHQDYKAAPPKKGVL